MERERFNIPEEQIGDYTQTTKAWRLYGETYTYIDSFRTDGDGEWTAVIVQRKRDKKFFRFNWGLTRSESYHYEPQWREVKPTKVVTIKWGWD